MVHHKNVALGHRLALTACLVLTGLTATAEKTSDCACTCGCVAARWGERELVARMKRTILPTFALKPDSTIFDAVDYFWKMSRQYDPAENPAARRAVPFILEKRESEPDMKTAQANAKPLPKISGKNLSLYDALKLVCDTAGYDFTVRSDMVVVKPR